MIRIVENRIKKGRGFQLTSSPVDSLRLWINRNPHLEDLILVGSYGLTINAYNPAINELKHLTIFELVKMHKSNSFLRAIPPVKIKVLSDLDKTINPVVGSRVYASKIEKGGFGVTPMFFTSSMQR